MGIKFKISGPFEIPYEKSNGSTAKHISSSNVKYFWSDTEAHALSKKQGCYIFSLRVGKGFTPWYVGKTKVDLIGECFTDHKVRKYNHVVFRRKGTPVMFFVTRSDNRRVIRKPALGQLEVFLIQSGKMKNDDIENIQRTKNIPDWGIDGVIRSGKGTHNSISKSFCKMMGL